MMTTKRTASNQESIPQPFITSSRSQLTQPPSPTPAIPLRNLTSTCCINLKRWTYELRISGLFTVFLVTCAVFYCSYRDSQYLSQLISTPQNADSILDWTGRRKYNCRVFDNFFALQMVVSLYLYLRRCVKV